MEERCILRTSLDLCHLCLSGPTSSAHLLVRPETQQRAGKWRMSVNSPDTGESMRARAKELKKLRRRADSYQQIATQSALYIASFLIYWLPCTTASNLLHDSRKWTLTNDWFYLVLFAVALQLFQGFLNFLITIIGASSDASRTHTRPVAGVENHSILHLAKDILWRLWGQRSNTRKAV